TRHVASPAKPALQTFYATETTVPYDDNTVQIQHGKRIDVQRYVLTTTPPAPSSPPATTAPTAAASTTPNAATTAPA
ncbi:MAG: hypothetical protein Q9183_005718, partial [Haloplaca sp. 2 TL-2023]